MSKVTRIALVGASGLIGSALIRLAVGRSDIRVIAVARREIALPKGARMEVLVADPANWADAIAAAGSSSFYFHLAEAIRAHRLVLPRGFGQALVAANFLCGVGACMACAADVAGGRRRVCLRGPVFDLTAVV